MWLTPCLFFMSSVTMSYHLNEIEPSKQGLLLLNTAIIYYILFRQLWFKENLKQTYVVWSGLLATSQIITGEIWGFISTAWIVSSMCWQFVHYTNPYKANRNPFIQSE